MAGSAQGTERPVVFAATDIGSNATKILIWEIARDKRWRERFQKRYPLRLDDVYRLKQIEPSKVVRLSEVFLEIAAICREQAVSQLRAVASDAFRSASNGRRVADAITLESGIEPEVLAAEEEGRLIAEGVLLDDATRRGEFLILDIGGGSAEIILPDRRGGVHTTSLALGAVRLREMFVRSDPIAPNEYAALQAHVEKTVTKATAAMDGRWLNSAVGCGGGVRFLHAMCGVLCGALSQHQPVRLDQVEHLCQAIWPMRVDSITRHYGIDHERAEIIVPGAVVLLSLMKHLKLATLRPSGRGVRHGLLADFLRTLP